MEHAVITGAGGFLGAAVTGLLLRRGIRVTAVMRPGSPNLKRLPESERLRVLELNMEDLSRLPETGLPPSSVFYHFAWDGTRAPARDDGPLQERNYRWAMDAVKTAAKLGCGAFIGAGSQAEYGVVAGGIGETGRTANPVTAYGKAKLKTYQDGSSYAKSRGMRFVWPRIFSLYGTYDYENSLIVSCLRKMLRGEAVDLTACTQEWDYLHVSDAAQALFLTGADKKAEGMYHVASGEARPLKDFVREMARLTRFEGGLNFGAVPYPPEGAVSLKPAANRLKRDLGWRPQITFEQGISAVLNEMQRNGRENEND